MISTPTPALRCTLQSFKLQPTLLRSYHASTFHIHHQTQQRPTTHRPLPPQAPLTKPPPSSALRFASDTCTHPASTHPGASSPAASNPAQVPPASTNPQSISSTQSTSTPQETQSPPASPPEPQQPPTDTLTWNTYLSLRRSRRRYSLLASLLTSTSSTIAGLSLIQANMDALGSALGSVFGLDPIFMLGIATVATGGVGWLLGPFVGEGLFRVVHRREWGRMAAKEKDFYNRIRKYRVDPSLASYSNPLPDYYGEKIGSVKDFRTWMRDQRAYNRKRMSV
ncbi:MAG: hypothetical protein LQ338_001398 [Usnochroma carphineum]|nr:MAG: hypothetical protein LQ338_001398 [Usnochroma carphineum]